MIQRAIREKSEFNIIDPKTKIKIDFWIKKDDDFSREMFKRKVKKKINRHILYFISPEDLILKKLEWLKISESEKQREDIRSILRFSKVNLNYIKKWAKKLSANKILAEILKSN